MLGIIGVHATVMYSLTIFLPPSPRWLVLKNREKEAKQVLAKLRVSATGFGVYSRRVHA